MSREDRWRDEDHRSYGAERWRGRDEDDRRSRRFDDDRHEDRSFRPFGAGDSTAYGFGPGFVDPMMGFAPLAAMSFPYGGLYGVNAAPYGRRDDRYTPNPREGRGEEPRSWTDRAADEVASWFGDRGAERRREWDERRAHHRGRGPKGYRRSDERVREDVNDHLTDDPWLDASEIEVTVSECEVTLSGTVASRDDKRRAEMLAERVSGVHDVQNNIKVRREPDPAVASTRTDAY